MSLDTMRYYKRDANLNLITLAARDDGFLAVNSDNLILSRVQLVCTDGTFTPFMG